MEVGNELISLFNTKHYLIGMSYTQDLNLYKSTLSLQISYTNYLLILFSLDCYYSYWPSPFHYGKTYHFHIIKQMKGAEPFFVVTIQNIIVVLKCVASFIPPIQHVLHCIPM